MIGVHIFLSAYILVAVGALIKALKKRASCPPEEREIGTDIRIALFGIISGVLFYGSTLIVKYTDWIFP